MSPLRADVVINEVMTAGSKRALKWSATGVPQLGFGAPWHSQGFDDATWQTGTGPFGFGSFPNADPLAPATNLATAMQNQTPTCYLRKTFEVSAADAARTDALRLFIRYNDGFVCYINGKEAVRRNAGPTNGFVYHDQFAAFGTPANAEPSSTPALRTEDLVLPAANTLLVEGTNVIAIHGLNYWESTQTVNGSSLLTVDNRNNFYIAPNLDIGGANPVSLVASTAQWKYFPGVAEPSGGVSDPALLTSGKQRVLWGHPAFDDTTWSTGAAPFGAGNPPAGVTLGTNLTSQVPTKSTSVYFRIVFNATPADAALTNAMILRMGFDDGFVAYINGVEVARANMQEANSFTPFNAVASTAGNGSNLVSYTLDPPSRLLVPGQNVLAVQVHNLHLNDADLFFRGRLEKPGGQPMVDLTNTWRYFVGLTEPLVTADESLEDNAEAPDFSLDWVELRNTGAEPAALDGWSLSDDPADPAKWRFPAGTTIAPGEFLLLACDSQDIAAPAPGGLLHTNFNLSGDGETVGLYDANGALVQHLPVPALTPFHSYGRDSQGAYKFLATPTPKSGNSEEESSGGIVATPVFGKPGGFYPSGQVITVSTATSGATIRYTFDGSEPTATTGIPYGSGISVGASAALRVAAFKPGMVPSKTVTSTFLINEPISRRSVPAVALVGEQGRSLYRPHGIMAIVGGAHTNMSAPNPTGLNSIWSQAPSGGGPADLSAYNHPIHRGRFMERPVNFELLYPNGDPGLNTLFGLRISGSGHARPRYRLTNQNSGSPHSGAWSTTDFTQKPSFNFFFRGDLGGDPLEFPIFPGSPVAAFHDLRCRAGKNDPSNPFIEDELMRRLFVDTGQVGSRGIINTLYVNGVYKGYYNLCEHLREDFFQRHHGSDLAWDVRQVTTVASGDGLSFQEMINFIRNNPQASLPNYQAMTRRLDIVNFADYLLVNILGVTGDWPHNNYVAARERSTNGVFRYYLWDAEGAFGDFSGNVRTNQFNTGTTGSVVTNSASSASLAEGIRILYTLLKASPEFRLVMADRIQKHFFNGGALTEAKVLTRFNELRAVVQPLLNGGSVTDRVSPWMNGVGNGTRYTLSGGTSGSVVNNPSRRQVLFSGYFDDTASGGFVQAHFVAEGLWPATRAPNFSQFGGSVSPGHNLTLTNPNATGTIYYTIDGSDPRAQGGVPQGTAGTSVTIDAPCTVRARVRNTNGEWSPATEAFFDTGVSPSLLVTEIMYHPADEGSIDGDEYEFIEIKNVGAQPVPVFGMKLKDGISYTFPAGTSIAPGEHKVIVRNETQFAIKYPSVSILGAWGAGSNLSNSGEPLTLTDAAGRAIATVSYTDASPWPVAADGKGRSLVPVDPNSNPAPGSPASWRASTNAGGSPGADDPAPPTLPILVNELIANPSPGIDLVELHNPNETDVSVSDWWLSDDLAVPKKYRIAAGTSIPPGGYLVLTQAQFGSGPGSFAFGADGDQVILSSGDASGNLTGYSHAFDFEGSEPGVSFGRVVNSQGAEFFVAQKTTTFGAPNSGPIVGPVVLAELMVLPEAGGDEYVEIKNIGNQPIPLFDPANPANTWRIGGIAFTFPADVTLQPRQVALITPLAPAAFASKYGVPAGVAIYGPYTGALNNSGERIVIEKPGVPFTSNGSTVVPYIDVDAVTYSALAPWPAVAGNGMALEKINARAFGDDPQNWQASAAGGTIGKNIPLGFAAWSSHHFTAPEIANPNIGGPDGDPDGDGVSNLREWAHGLNPLAMDAADAMSCTIEPSGGTPYLTLRYRRSLSATGAAFLGDTAGEVGSWALDAAIPTGTAVNNGDGTETLFKRDTVPASDADHRFMRLRIGTQQ